MKLRVFLLMFFTLACTTTYSQNMSVKSFRMLESDMDARVNYPKRDQNGEKCAIIKVVNTEQGFAWEGDALGITDVVKKTGEYWLYVPHGARKLTIKHDKLGVLRDYLYPVTIKEAIVYEMVLTTAKVTTIVEEQEIPMQWLVIRTEPEEADVYINDQYMGISPYTKKMETGNYTYRVEKGLYHTDAGTFDLTADTRKDLTITLKPNFGYVSIKSNVPASVDIDGISTGKTTPFTSQKLASGKHKLTVKKVMYKPITVEFEVTDGNTTPLNVELEPNFATINITTSPEADIYIDDVRQSKGTHTGRLLPGLHTLEAKKEKHTSDKKQREFNAGDDVNISLHPMPIAGSIDIMSEPIDANIKINGKNYGSTPTTIKDLLIGDYTLTIEKQGYGTITKTITIRENQTESINETLLSGKQVTINSQPQGASINIDGVVHGNTPQTLTLGFGDHAIKLVNGKKVVQENITINQTSKSNFSFDVSEIIKKTRSDEVSDDDMITNYQLKTMNVGSKIVLENIFFETNKFTIKQESIAELRHLTNQLKKNPSIRVEISGHTDNVGSYKTNERMSEGRAKEVVEYLINAGIKSRRLEYIGHAFNQPIADNNTAEGRAKNRRIELKIFKK